MPKDSSKAACISCIGQKYIHIIFFYLLHIGNPAKCTKAVYHFHYLKYWQSVLWNDTEYIMSNKCETDNLDILTVIKL